MPDWLRAAVSSTDTLPSAEVVVVRTALAVLLGFAVAGVHRVTQGRRDDSAFRTTLVLLAVLLGLVTLVIGDNVARAFGLVGALSIVRFRTIVEDTRDTAFVIFAVIMGMAAGAGYAQLALAGVPAVGLAAWAMNRLERPRADEPLATLVVRVGLGHDPAALCAAAFAKHFANARPMGAATISKGAGLELTYRGQLRSPAAAFALVNELNRTEGVLAAELKCRDG